MKRIRVSDLRPAVHLVYSSLYHECGQKLHPSEGTLAQRHIDLMRSCGIDAVYEVTDSRDFEEFRRTVLFRTVPVSTLESGRPISEPLYSSNHVLLLHAEAMLTPLIKARLIERGYHNVYLKKTAAELNAGAAERYLRERPGVEAAGGPARVAREATADFKGGSMPFRAEVKFPRQLDRRHHRRYSGECPMSVVVQLPFSSRWNRDPYVGTVKDISMGGVCILVQEELSRGQKFKFVVQPDPNRARLSGIGEVVRIRRMDAGFEAGARFLSIGAVP